MKSRCTDKHFPMIGQIQLNIFDGIHLWQPRHTETIKRLQCDDTPLFNIVFGPKPMDILQIHIFLIYSAHSFIRLLVD